MMRRKDNSKEKRVKEAVIKLILSEGFEGTSISKIAREAGVSPATVYIYYESKEQMLSSIYQEYANAASEYLLSLIRPDMNGKELISSLVRGYYDFITDNMKIFSFVEQCSHCPALNDGISNVSQIFALIESMKQRGYLIPYSSESLAAVMFYPVKAISFEFPTQDMQADHLLDELIQILQKSILND